MWFSDRSFFFRCFLPCLEQRALPLLPLLLLSHSYDPGGYMGPSLVYLGDFLRGIVATFFPYQHPLPSVVGYTLPFSFDPTCDKSMILFSSSSNPLEAGTNLMFSILPIFYVRNGWTFMATTFISYLRTCTLILPTPPPPPRLFHLGEILTLTPLFFLKLHWEQHPKNFR